MTTLDTIIQMQKNGMTDYEISTNLQAQGVSPRDINDSLNQAKIKSAVTDIQQPGTQPQQTFPPAQETIAQPPATMMPQAGQAPAGIMSAAPAQQPPAQISAQPEAPQAPQPQAVQPQPMEEFPQPQESIMQPQPTAGYPQDTYSTQDPYAAQDPYAQDVYGEEYYGEGEGGYAETETITEIAEQVIKEKFKEYKKRTGDVAGFITTTQDKISNIDQRLKRLENTIDKLQHAIIQKVGEFGENTNLIKKDLDALHNTTSKLMNPLIDNYRELQKANEKKHRH